MIEIFTFSHVRCRHLTVEVVGCKLSFSCTFVMLIECRAQIWLLSVLLKLRMHGGVFLLPHTPVSHAWRLFHLYLFLHVWFPRTLYFRHSYNGFVSVTCSFWVPTYLCAPPSSSVFLHWRVGGYPQKLFNISCHPQTAYISVSLIQCQLTWLCCVMSWCIVLKMYVVIHFECIHQNLFLRFQHEPIICTSMNRESRVYELCSELRCCDLETLTRFVNQYVTAF